MLPCQRLGRRLTAESGQYTLPLRSGEIVLTTLYPLETVECSKSVTNRFDAVHGKR
jgi:hypothetical protein